jgi:hypothetical protein
MPTSKQKRNTALIGPLMPTGAFNLNAPPKDYLVPFSRKQLRQARRQLKPVQQLRANNRRQPASMTVQALPVRTNTIVRQPFNRLATYTITHHENIADITGSTTSFAIATNLPIQPGLASSFPWLAPQANQWETYSFKSLVFQYVSRASSSETGYVSFGVDFDPGDPPPTSANQLNNWESAVQSPPSANFSMPVLRRDDNRLRRYFTRDAIIAAELSSYDLGTFYAIVGGQTTSTNVIGSIYAQYTIELRTPQVASTSSPVPRNNSVYVNGANIALSASTLLTFNTVIYNPYGINIVAGQITNVKGVFVVYAQQTLGVSAFTSATLNILKNGTVVIAAAYPAPVATFTTANVEAIVSLVPSDILTIVVNTAGVTGNALTGAPIGSNNILVLTPA